jgi:hypothetical protein
MAFCSSPDLQLSQQPAYQLVFGLLTIFLGSPEARILIGLFGDNPPNPDELKLVLRTEMFVVERLIPRPLFRSSIFLGTEPGI